MHQVVSRKRTLFALFASGAIALVSGLGVLAVQASPRVVQGDEGASSTTTPIKHLVIIYQENNSFDHYFATYPVATNPAGEPSFSATDNTPSINGLNDVLLAPDSPNTVQPFRLDRSQSVTCDQNHGYSAEQSAYDSGLMDKFPELLGVANTVKVGLPPNQTAVPCDYGHGKGLVMGYYDGNTVTAIWNYAQHFSMSDNTFETTFLPSTPGNINLISAQTHGFTPDTTSFGTAVTVNDTIIGDPQPAGDICSTRDTSTQLLASTDKNIGDLLNAKNVTWGFFQGGFREASGTSVVTGQPTTNTCQIGHANVGGVWSADYIAHHESFQYYRSTQNLQHLAPTSTAMIGRTDQANHQYDLSDFWTAVKAHDMPAVSFLKAPAYQDGHPGYSDPIDEQHFVVDTLNQLQRTQEWSSTAAILVWDDSDGWYDHVMGPVVNQSNDPSFDRLANGNNCGTNPNDVSGGYLDRCAYGPRVPLLAVSGFAKQNYVDHSVTDQASVLRLIEDNWTLGRIGDASLDAKAGSLMDLFNFTNAEGNHSNKLFLDPNTGERAKGG